MLSADGMPPEPFEGIDLKIRRAQGGLAEVDRLLDEWSRPPIGPYSLLIKLHAYEGFYVYRISASDKPPRIVAVVIGEITFHLRSALDQAIWALSDVSRLTEPQRKRIQFPILHEPNKGIWKSSLAGVTDEVADVVERFQPYLRESGYQVHPLWALSEINRIDKHRLTRFAKPIIDMPNVPGIITASGSLNHGDVCAIAPFETDPEDHFEPYVSFHVSICVGDDALGLTMSVNQLWDIHDYVRDDVLPALARFLP